MCDRLFKQLYKVRKVYSSIISNKQMTFTKSHTKGAIVTGLATALQGSPGAHKMANNCKTKQVHSLYTQIILRTLSSPFCRFNKS